MQDYYSELSHNGHLEFVLSVLQSFYCNLTLFKTDTTKTNNGHFETVNRHLRSAFWVKNTLERTIDVEYDRKYYLGKQYLY